VYMRSLLDDFAKIQSIISHKINLYLYLKLGKNKITARIL
jgi:hypothetical protein